MKNIGIANIVILKQLKKEVRNNYVDSVAGTKSQKLASTKIFEQKFFWPTSLITELLPKTIASKLSFFSLILEDADIKNSMITYGCGYKLSSVFFLNQKKQIQFYKKNIGIYNIPKPMYCQKLIETKIQLQFELFHKTLVLLLV